MGNAAIKLVSCLLVKFCQVLQAPCFDLFYLTVCAHEIYCRPNGSTDSDRTVLFKGGAAWQGVLADAVPLFVALYPVVRLD